MADASMKVSLTWDFSGMVAGFRQAADALEALQASLTPDAPAPAAATENPADLTGESAATDPEGP